MTYEEITDRLKTAIKDRLGFPVFLLPQTATNNTAHIDLQFQDCTLNGEDSVQLYFIAEYVTDGTHKQWLTKTIRLRQKLHAAEEDHIPVPVDNNGSELRSYWESLGGPRWVYPTEDESSMPARYVMQYRVTLSIPSRLLEE